MLRRYHPPQQTETLWLPGLDPTMPLIEIQVPHHELVAFQPPEFAHGIAKGIMAVIVDQVPTIIGTSEAATILSVTKQRVGQLVVKRAIPEPFLQLRATPLWYTFDIVHSAISRRRTPGAPRA